MPIESTYLHLISSLKSLDADSVVLLRATKGGRVAILETLAMQIAHALGLNVQLFMPEGPGREATYHRDYRLVESADAVIAYFSPDRVMDGGTGHVVEAALNREVPVTAWVAGPSTFERVGELEPSDLDR